ncbi:Voltage-dependent anion-selective channel protein 2 [Microtus ochrogaster]|nr:Voltage-dependent anion-selective channel protein 2 [Microtus ochrogaster]
MGQLAKLLPMWIEPKRNGKASLEVGRRLQERNREALRAEPTETGPNWFLGSPAPPEDDIAVGVEPTTLSPEVEGVHVTLRAAAPRPVVTRASSPTVAARVPLRRLRRSRPSPLGLPRTLPDPWPASSFSPGPSRTVRDSSPPGDRRALNPRGPSGADRFFPAASLWRTVVYGHAHGEFSTSGSSNTDTGKVSGTLETKYKWCEYGLTFTEKWNTDNTLGTEIAIEDQICQGLKLTFDTTFSPNTGKKSGKIKSAYKRECINLGCDVDFDFAGPAIHGSAVFGYEGWLAGYQMTFDSAKSKLTRSNFAVGYRTGDFQLHTNVNNGTEFGGSIYQKVCEDFDTSVNLAWTSGTNCTRFGIAAKYQLDPTASISAKVNNSSLIGVGYTQTLRPGVKLTLSALVDGKSFNAGGHKLGLALELEA